MSLALVFPGQGSQTVGMGRELAEAFPESRKVFDEVDEALGERLSALIFDGPEDALTLTANAQPALMAVSLAAMRALESRGLDLGAHAAFVAGHSLGEYSALAAAGSLSITDAARLLRIRGKAMQAAVRPGEGAMAAIIGLDETQLAAVCAQASEGGVCQIANDNGGGQIVISGTKAAVERGMQLASEAGAKRAIALAVSAPFHSMLMQPAAERMREALAGAWIEAPRVPLVANVLASAISDPDEIRLRLVEQVTGQVRWRESMSYLADAEVDLLFEVGAGKVLSGLAKRIDKRLAAQPVGTPAEVDAAMAKLA
ncbi:ACP S-malonyltransferase [Aureimonas pseudogalii]|uniref:Malonyl CoA-acyl carrier protein transacylase n=1 Tax=Aureimonas pseudogalii TaxID=1744844 RepID=A0A7W6EC02_9HYPH|nr:ACP S-malonyltransferase [Aureimonas pseudogalii]MBB3998558.1 [acyl-carrier-protein] S-malonyltransferase [Aureimonas pseudogalii]